MHHSAQSTQISDHEIRLFRHAKRPQWGVAALIWERNGKRGYQFSDGRLRVFKEGFYAMFQSALPPGDGSATAVRRLARLAHAEDVTEATRLPTLRDQIALFRRDYPGGFSDEAWLSRYRGARARKRLKRHRDASLIDAASLSVEALDDAIVRFAWSEVHDSMIELLAKSDLVTSTHLNKLRRVAPSRGLTLALREWLHGASEGESEAEHDRRFNVLVRELQDAGTWPLVTSLGALVHPSAHTCVRESSFVLQGKMLLSAFAIARRPQGSDYRRLCHVAHAVRRELSEAGLAPTDLLDVYDFIWLTLRPAARESLLTVPLATAELEPGPAQASTVPAAEADDTDEVAAA